MATNYTLKAGHILTVTAGAVRASVQAEDGSVAAFISSGFEQSFGPYLVERNFTVSDGASVSSAAYMTALAALLTSNAGVPDDAAASTVDVNPTGDDNGLTFTAVTYGVGGDAISIQYVDPGADDAALAVSVAGQAITVSLATDGNGDITSTAADVLAAIEADPAASALVSVAIMTADSGAGDDGSGVVTAMAPTSLADGAGFGVGVVLPGALCVDSENADVYRNDGTTAAPAWIKVGDAA